MTNTNTARLAAQTEDLKMTQSTYPLIIVEIPHQRPPRAWIAWNLSALDQAADAADRDGSLRDRLLGPCLPRDPETGVAWGGDDSEDAPPGWEWSRETKPDIDDLLQIIGHDLSSLTAITEDEWPSFRPSGHGSIGAYAAAVSCAVTLGWLRPMVAVSA